MKATLRDFAAMADENDCELMLDELMSFDTLLVSYNQQQNILSRVTRKTRTQISKQNTKKKRISKIKDRSFEITQYRKVKRMKKSKESQCYL